MFALFDLILATPIGALILAALQNTFDAILVITDCDDCGFNDLGKLLFGGVIVAVLIGIGASLLWRRVRDGQTNSSHLVSIHLNERK